MKKDATKWLLAIAIILVSTQLQAQFGGGGGTPGGGGAGGGIPATGGGPVVPFDGGMSLILLASGVGYAAKRIKKLSM
ncbi:hypothetical protein [Parasediminibacterium sp. JCM 36343]|uniref:hypothetical protein n=1 Tax=Parasediminibacterium sp. JCM 36343 TaxID=3374279 RepID=UPI00397E8EE9